MLKQKVRESELQLELRGILVFFCIIRILLLIVVEADLPYTQVLVKANLDPIGKDERWVFDLKQQNKQGKN